MPSASISREDCLFYAKLAEEANRFTDVVDNIKLIANHIDARLTIEERGLLSVAFKNLANTSRNSWRIVDALEKIEASSKTPKQLPLMRRQRQRIEKDIRELAQDIIMLLDERLIPCAPPGEESVFYHKMKGDYYRYLFEISRGRERTRITELSLSAYKSAYKQALSKLEPMHPTRLGLALNFAVFFHDCHNSAEKACHLAKAALDDAVMSLESMDHTYGQTIRDSLTILQLLRDDLILWAQEMEPNGTK